MPSCRSPSRAKRAGTVAMVHSRGSTSSTSSQRDRGGHGRLGHAAHRVGAGDGVVAGVLVVVDEQLGWVPVLAPPGSRHLARARGAPPPGRRRTRPGGRRRNPSAARSARRCAARCRPRSSATRPRPARRVPRARRGRPGARSRIRSAASGPGRSATRRAARCRPAASSTDGTPRWTSGPPTGHWPVRSRTARRRAGRSAGSSPAPSPATGAPRRDPLLVHLLPGHPGREAMHHAGPLAQRAHDAVTDRQVVAGQVELGLAAGREVDPAGIGDPDSPAPDLEFGFCCRGHTKKLTTPGRENPAGPGAGALRERRVQRARSAAAGSLSTAHSRATRPGERVLRRRAVADDQGRGRGRAVAARCSGRALPGPGRGAAARLTTSSSRWPAGSSAIACRPAAMPVTLRVRERAGAAPRPAGRGAAGRPGGSGGAAGRSAPDAMNSARVSWSSAAAWPSASALGRGHLVQPDAPEGRASPAAARAPGSCSPCRRRRRARARAPASPRPAAGRSGTRRRSRPR